MKMEYSEDLSKGTIFNFVLPERNTIWYIWNRSFNDLPEDMRNYYEKYRNKNGTLLADKGRKITTIVKAYTMLPIMVMDDILSGKSNEGIDFGDAYYTRLFIGLYMFALSWENINGTTPTSFINTVTPAIKYANDKNSGRQFQINISTYTIKGEKYNVKIHTRNKSKVIYLSFQGRYNFSVKLNFKSYADLLNAKTRMDIQTAVLNLLQEVGQRSANERLCTMSKVWHYQGVDLRVTVQHQ